MPVGGEEYRPVAARLRSKAVPHGSARRVAAGAVAGAAAQSVPRRPLGWIGRRQGRFSRCTPGQQDARAGCCPGRRVTPKRR